MMTSFWRGFDNPFVDLKLPSPPEGKDGYARSAAWSPNGKLLACSTVFGTVYLWDPTTGKLLHTLKDPIGNDQQAPVSSVAWSPDSTRLASSSYHGTISIWDVRTGMHQHILEGHEDPVCSVGWSPDGGLLASGSVDKTIRLWDPTTGAHRHTLEGHTNAVRSLTWSPDNKWIVSGSNDKTVRVWDATEFKLQHTLEGHAGYIRLVAWEPGSLHIASGSHDGTIKIWNPIEGTLVHTLEGHTGQVCSVAWFPKGPLLASVSYINKESFPYDAEVRLWHTDTWELLAFRDKLKGYMHSAWHPSDLQLATVASQEGHIAIWKLEGWERLLQVAAQEIMCYKNAKVVLVGDSGVGKSGLSLVLTGKPFAPTESTHGRYVRTFESREVDSDDGRKEMQETLLWDLAGQPDYRLIHQFHLHEATVALIVFDAARENDALAGVRYWQRALRLAQQACGSAALPLTIFLVAARIDRGSKRMSTKGIEALVQELGCAGYIETSAKTGQGVEELSQAMHAALDWNTLPGITSTQLLQDIRTHLLCEVQTGQLLRTVDELYLSFLRAFTISTQDDTLRQQFEEVLGRLDAQGVLHRFSFGNQVLLQPERLDAYASALLIAVGNETDGLGSISEERVREGTFFVPHEDRIGNAVQERLLLLAMIEELVRQELALREGGWLLFPSQSTRERPQQATWSDQQEVTFSFAGPVLSIYTTLVVRLAHSGIFQKQDLWQYVVTYTTRLGGIYGLLLTPRGEERADLVLFFDEAAGEEMRFHFEDFVQSHLQRHVSGPLERRRRVVCPKCGEVFTKEQVSNRRRRGFTALRCSTCETEFSLSDGLERLATPAASQLKAMERTADEKREQQSAAITLQGKRAVQKFDVFLCHNTQDKPAVKRIGEQLMRRGILPWLDEWVLPPGWPWQRVLEEQISRIKAVAVFVGPNGVDSWQREELDAFVREFVERGCPVIPVLLQDALEQPKLPVFLKGRTWVDFRVRDPDPIERLIWGINGQREE